MPKPLKLPPENFELECSTVWSFPRRWNWMTHNSKYRWNWSPEVVRNLILRYSQEWDYLLDPMIWGWTTAIEAKLLNRNLLCYDVNPNAIELTNKALDFEIDPESSSGWQENNNSVWQNAKIKVIQYFISYQSELKGLRFTMVFQSIEYD